jgi:hypothetical protein
MNHFLRTEDLLKFWMRQYPEKTFIVIHDPGMDYHYNIVPQVSLRMGLVHFEDAKSKGFKMQLYHNSELVSFCGFHPEK